MGEKPLYAIPSEGRQEVRVNFEKTVRSDKVLHEHFKLEDAFTGPPIQKFHKELHKISTPPVKSDQLEDD